MERSDVREIDGDSLYGDDDAPVTPQDGDASYLPPQPKVRAPGLGPRPPFAPHLAAALAPEPVAPWQRKADQRGTAARLQFAKAVGASSSASSSSTLTGLQAAEQALTTITQHHALSMVAREEALQGRIEKTIKQVHCWAEYCYHQVIRSSSHHRIIFHVFPDDFLI